MTTNVTSKFFKEFIAIAFSFCICFGFSQSNDLHMNYWQFGQNVGLDFSSGTPVSLTGTSISTNEGCASMSSSSGQFLFYTDGIIVWDRNNNAMPNGTGLLGDPSASQSGVAIPSPADTNQYYLITVDNVSGPDGVHYSIVDMTLPGNGTVGSPLGDVTGIKNVSLQNQVVSGENISEKIGVVRHCNGTDFWVVLERLHSNSSRFYVYLLSASGFSLTSSSSGYGPQQTDEVGYLKFSPDGRWMANTSYYGTSATQIYSFNPSNGTITHVFSSGNSPDFATPYGVEFSEDSKLIYIANYDGGKILQCDLSSASSAIFQSSANLILSHSDNIGAMQLGPDGNIYAAESYDSEEGLTQISYVNSFGGAVVTTDFITFPSGDVRDGLPTFYTNTSNPRITPSTQTFSGIADCPDSLYVNKDYDTYQWYRNDTLLTGEITSDIYVNAFIGDYKVIVTYSGSCTDTSNLYMNVCLTLPVELINFRGEKCDRNNCVFWQTASEKDNDYFEIQRTLDGIIWKTIGMVNGFGTTNELQNYNFIDYGIFESCYYRLKQVDFNGKFEYSEMIFVKRISDDFEIIQLDNETIKVNSFQKELIGITVMNVTGKTVLSNPNLETNQSLSLGKIGAGIYIIQAVKKTGEINSKKILVH